MRIINPLNLIEDDINVLFTLLTGNKTCVFWQKNEDYIVQGKTIQLSHHLLLNTPIDNNLSYLILGQDNIGTGATAIVRPVECTINFVSNNQVRYAEYNQYVVKAQIQKQPIPAFAESCYQRLRQEYNLFSNISHLGYKPPLLHISPEFTSTFLVMNYMPGIELFELINLNVKKQCFISSSVKLRITRAILDAFKTQVVDYNIYHSDLKLENMRIDLGFDAKNIPAQLDASTQLKTCTVKIIDYATSIPFGSPINGLWGTKGYQAPEIISNEDPIVVDEKADLYALGQSLIILWGFGAYQMVFPENEWYSEKYINCVCKWFHKPENDDIKIILLLKQIIDVLLKMINPDPQERLSLSEARAAFIEIIEACAEETRVKNINISNDTINFETSVTQHPSAHSENEPIQSNYYTNRTINLMFAQKNSLCSDHSNLRIDKITNERHTP